MKNRIIKLVLLVAGLLLAIGSQAASPCASPFLPIANIWRAWHKRMAMPAPCCVAPANRPEV